MATNIGNPDPPLIGLTRPSGDPATSIGMGSVDDTVRVGTLLMTKAVGKIVPGATSFSIRNHADNTDNFMVLDGGAIVINGSISAYGVFDLITPNGASSATSFNTELITLSTSTTVTTSVSNLLPANSLINAVLVNCVAGIVTSTSFKLGDPTSDARFLSFTTSIGLNQASAGFNQWNPALATTLALSAIQAVATTVKITVAASVATAGQLRVTVFYTAFSGPTS